MNVTVSVLPTAEEWRVALKKTRVRRSSAGADVVKSVILGVLTLYCWIPFFLDGAREWQSFFVGALALVLNAALWLVPYLADKKQAREIVAAGVPVTVTLRDTEIGFGEGERQVTMPYTEPRACITETLCILTFPEGTVTVLPRRCFDAVVWEFLCNGLQEATE